ncbi:alpha/beta hydrolase family protein [Frigoribacterium sp. 2-23]|uniref:alpha/beta hydrolase family protein n=1 Tax=Frigoribacterium sp. 2-23 TaxID=3415006 RepID=UPI003C6F81FA
MPALDPTPVISIRPLVIPVPGRGDDLQIRVSAPAEGSDLPVIVMAHGFGLDLTAYDPLVDHWTAHGFVVVQPTFLDSASLGVAPTDPRYPTIWEVRVDDLVRVLDGLPRLLDALPGLAERVDLDRIALAGHSWGAQSIGMLLGARVIGADGTPGESRLDPRVSAGVLLAATGIGGDDLSPFAQENFAFMSPEFDSLTVPSIVVAGDHDQSMLSSRGPDWFTDVYRLSPGARHLVTLFGGEHSLGGIQAYGSTQTTDESPERVALVRETTTAFLRTALGVDDGAWARVAAAVSAGAGAASAGAVGRIDSK